MFTVRQFISLYANTYKGELFDDALCREMETAAHKSQFNFRWLEPKTKVSSQDFDPRRINVHVDKNHIVTKVTAG